MKIKKIFIAILFFLAVGLYSCINNLLNTQDENYTLQNIDSTDKKNTAHIFVLSDWGFNGSNGQKEVAKAMADIAKKVDLDFILTCGDNFQYSGVSSSTDSMWFYNWVNIYNDSSLNVPWYPALGNHDYYGNPDAEVAFSGLNNNWKMISRYYTFTKDINNQVSIRFVIIDTSALISEIDNLTDSGKIDSIKQYAWIKNTLLNNKEKWTIVLGHHTIFSSGVAHGDTPELKKYLKPLLDKYKVDFYICGHDHDFEHAKDTNNYTDYIVTGTGGSPRWVGTSSNTVFSVSSLGFTYIDAHYNYLKLYFINSESKVIYCFEKDKILSNRR